MQKLTRRETVDRRKIMLMSEAEMIDYLVSKYSEWTETYNINPYHAVSIHLATELKQAIEREELHSYVKHAK
jgi:hypothetical protein